MKMLYTIGCRGLRIADLFFWMKYSCAIELLYIAKLYVSLCIRNEHHLSQICFYTTMRDVMLSRHSQSYADVISAFSDTSRYLDDAFNIENPFYGTCTLVLRQEFHIRSFTGMRFIKLKKLMDIPFFLHCFYIVQPIY